jgi:hypothetical protein
MAEFLILKLFSSGLLSILLLLPLYYLLGYSTLSMVNSIWYLRFKQSHRFQLVLATGSVLLVKSTLYLSINLRPRRSNKFRKS